MPSARLASSLCAAVLIATVVGSLAAQAAPSLTLGKPNAKSKYTLGMLFALQELPDGRVVASDRKEQVFRLVDLNRGDVGLLGKQGDGADTYRTASAIFRLPGDSLGLYDSQGRKMLHVTPQGTVAGMIPLPTMSNNRRLGIPVGADFNQNLYFTISETFDTVTRALSGIGGITRLSPGADADEQQLTYRTRRTDQTKLTGSMPFVFRDAVAIRSDGLMARVVADTYQVIWGRNAKEIGRTGPLPFTPVMLDEHETKAAKDSVIDFMKSMMAGGAPGGTSFSNGGGRGGAMAMGGGDLVVVMMGGGGGGAPMIVGGAGSGAVMIERAVAEAKATGAAGGGDVKVVNGAAAFNPADMKFGEFPAYKPPMPSSGVVAMFDVAGNLWVARTSTHGDNVPHFDLIAEGKGLIARVNLPTGTRLLGFGKNSVYVARSDEGSDWLERYAMPKM